MVKLKVWDGFVRLFHWSLLPLLAGLWYSGEQGLMDWHFALGGVLASLLLSRIVWGMFGSSTARLAPLFVQPGRVWQSLRQRSAVVAIGHSAPGGYMVLLLLVLMALQLITGLASNDDVLSEGPLVVWVGAQWSSVATRVHHLLFVVLQIAVVVHVLAIVGYRLAGKNLVPAMLHGHRTLDDSTQLVVSTPPTKRSWPAMLLLVLCNVLFALWLWPAWQGVFA